MLDQLAAIAHDAPGTEPLPDLDRRLADARPDAVTKRLQQERSALCQRLTVVETALAEADDAQRQLLNQHRERLTSRIDGVEHQIRGHGSRVAMWNWGRRPDGLVAAVQRRVDHLVHQAVDSQQPWVTCVLRGSHSRNPDSSLDDLHRLVSDVAAYRERANLSTDDPLGPLPTDPELCRQHEALRQRLDTTAPTLPDPSINNSLSL